MRKTNKEIIEELKDESKRSCISSSSIARRYIQVVRNGVGFLVRENKSIEPDKLYTLIEPNIPEVLKAHTKLPIWNSYNIRLENILPALGMQLNWFTHIPSSADVNEPKPALDGFYKMG